MDRNRPYDGQPHTDQGVRGKQLVEGLTMRDITDCYAMGVLDSSGHLNGGKLYDKVMDGSWDKRDLYEIEDWDRLDPIAISQNMSCRIEKMMGIFPNVPELSEDK